MTRLILPHGKKIYQRKADEIPYKFTVVMLFKSYIQNHIRSLKIVSFYKKNTQCYSIEFWIQGENVLIGINTKLHVHLWWLKKKIQTFF